MSIPLATTTISVYLPDENAEPYETRSLAQTATGVNAHFSSPSGSYSQTGGLQEVVDMRLDCDVCPLTYASVVVDDTTSEQWDVVWLRTRSGLDLDHIEAGVKRIQGMVTT